MGNDQAVPGHGVAGENYPAACSTDGQAQNSPSRESLAVSEGHSELQESQQRDAAARIEGKTTSGCDEHTQCQIRFIEVPALSGGQEDAARGQDSAQSCQPPGDQQEETAAQPQGPRFSPLQLLAVRQRTRCHEADTPLAGLKLCEREVCESSPPSAMARMELGGGATPLGCSPIVQHPPLRPFYAGHAAKSPTSAPSRALSLSIPPPPPCPPPPPPDTDETPPGNGRTTPVGFRMLPGSPLPGVQGGGACGTASLNPFAPAFEPYHSIQRHTHLLRQQRLRVAATVSGASTAPSLKSARTSLATFTPEGIPQQGAGRTLSYLQPGARETRFSTTGGSLAHIKSHAPPGFSAVNTRSPVFSASAQGGFSSGLSRGFGGSSKGLGEGLAEVLDPSEANKVLLQLGRKLRVTHLQIQATVKKAGDSGLRLNDLPAAFMKEHNAVLDLRSLGLMQIRELIGGMGHSLILEAQQERLTHCEAAAANCKPATFGGATHRGTVEEVVSAIKGANQSQLSPLSSMTWDEESQLVLKLGEPLPPVMKELLQHLLVSLVADALHHVGPPPLVTPAPQHAAAPLQQIALASLLNPTLPTAQPASPEMATTPVSVSPGVSASSQSPITLAVSCGTASPLDVTPFSSKAGNKELFSVDTARSPDTHSKGWPGPHARTRGLPLQLVPTLWQLKYGLRCSLPAMLEACGYSSLRAFVSQELPCLQISPPGSQVMLRLTPTSVAAKENVMGQHGPLPDVEMAGGHILQQACRAKQNYFGSPSEGVQKIVRGTGADGSVENRISSGLDQNSFPSCQANTPAAPAPPPHAAGLPRLVTLLAALSSASFKHGETERHSTEDAKARAVCEVFRQAGNGVLQGAAAYGGNPATGERTMDDGECTGGETVEMPTKPNAQTESALEEGEDQKHQPAGACLHADDVKPAPGEGIRCGDTKLTDVPCHDKPLAATVPANDIAEPTPGQEDQDVPGGRAEAHDHASETAPGQVKKTLLQRPAKGEPVSGLFSLKEVGISRLHLHRMLYEVIATGCEKRGRRWARGEDLIELEEEMQHQVAELALAASRTRGQATAQLSRALERAKILTGGLTVEKEEISSFVASSVPPQQGEDDDEELSSSSSSEDGEGEASDHVEKKHNRVEKGAASVSPKIARTAGAASEAVASEREPVDERLLRRRLKKKAKKEKKRRKKLKLRALEEQELEQQRLLGLVDRLQLPLSPKEPSVQTASLSGLSEQDSLKQQSAATLSPGGNTAVKLVSVSSEASALAAVDRPVHVRVSEDAVADCVCLAEAKSDFHSPHPADLKQGNTHLTKVSEEAVQQTVPSTFSDSYRNSSQPNEKSPPRPITQLLSSLSEEEVASELQSFHNRAVGMLVSAIKGEWARRFEGRAAPLSLYMEHFRVKQLKNLLLEVPNLLILGSGGSMRVSTLEHAMQFCRPFPPPATIVMAPSGKRVALPLTMTAPSPLACFRAHSYTHDDSSSFLTYSSLEPRGLMAAAEEPPGPETLVRDAFQRRLAGKSANRRQPNEDEDTLRGKADEGTQKEPKWVVTAGPRDISTEMCERESRSYAPPHTEQTDSLNNIPVPDRSCGDQFNGVHEGEQILLPSLLTSQRREGYETAKLPSAKPLSPIHDGEEQAQKQQRLMVAAAKALLKLSLPKTVVSSAGLFCEPHAALLNNDRLPKLAKPMLAPSRTAEATSSPAEKIEHPALIEHHAADSQPPVLTETALQSQLHPSDTTNSPPSRIPRILLPRVNDYNRADENPVCASRIKEAGSSNLSPQAKGISDLERLLFRLLRLDLHTSTAARLVAAAATASSRTGETPRFPVADSEARKQSPPVTNPFPPLANVGLFPTKSGELTDRCNSPIDTTRRADRSGSGFPLSSEVTEIASLLRGREHPPTSKNFSIQSAANGRHHFAPSTTIPGGAPSPEARRGTQVSSQASMMDVNGNLTAQLWGGRPPTPYYQESLRQQRGVAGDSPSEEWPVAASRLYLDTKRTAFPPGFSPLASNLRPPVFPPGLVYMSNSSNNSAGAPPASLHDLSERTSRVALLHRRAVTLPPPPPPLAPPPSSGAGSPGLNDRNLPSAGLVAAHLSPVCYPTGFQVPSDIRTDSKPWSGYTPRLGLTGESSTKGCSRPSRESASATPAGTGQGTPQRFGAAALLLELLHQHHDAARGIPGQRETAWNSEEQEPRHVQEAQETNEESEVTSENAGHAGTREDKRGANTQSIHSTKEKGGPQGNEERKAVKDRRNDATKVCTSDSRATESGTRALPVQSPAAILPADTFLKRPLHPHLMRTRGGVSEVEEHTPSPERSSELPVPRQGSGGQKKQGQDVPEALQLAAYETPSFPYKHPGRMQPSGLSKNQQEQIAGKPQMEHTGAVLHLPGNDTSQKKQEKESPRLLATPAAKWPSNTTTKKQVDRDPKDSEVVRVGRRSSSQHGTRSELKPDEKGFVSRQTPLSFPERKQRNARPPTTTAGSKEGQAEDLSSSSELPCTYKEEKCHGGPGATRGVDNAREAVIKQELHRAVSAAKIRPKGTKQTPPVTSRLVRGERVNAGCSGDRKQTGSAAQNPELKQQRGVETDRQKTTDAKHTVKEWDCPASGSGTAAVWQKKDAKKPPARNTS